MKKSPLTALPSQSNFPQHPPHPPHPQRPQQYWGGWRAFPADLGLAIVAEIGTMHDGEISFQTDQTTGLARSSPSTFRWRKRPDQGGTGAGSYGRRSNATLASGARRLTSSDPPARSTMLVTSCRPVPSWA